MKKIITLVLAVVMCLSFMTSVTAASNLNRDPSTIPGTDIEYNYVENVTIQIPGTEVTFEFKDVAGFVLFNPEYSFNSMEEDQETGEWISVSHSYDIPVYHFSVFEETGSVTLNNDGSWGVFRGCAMIGEGVSESFPKGQVISSSGVKMVRDVGSDVFNEYSTIIDADGLCCNPYEIDLIESAVAMVEIQIVDHNYFNEHSFDEGEFDINYYYGFNQWDLQKDISNFAVFDTTTYSIIDGANSVVNLDKTELIIRADGDFDKFTGVKVDGELVDSNNYVASEGSTVIEFKADYLKTLDVGEHTVTVVFKDGIATTKFEVKNLDFSVQVPSRNEIRNKDGIILHTNIEEVAPDGSYVVWTSNNNNFKEYNDDNMLKIIAHNKGYTTFTATLYDIDGNEIASDTVEMYSKSGFFDKIGGFFRSLFGLTKVYEN